MELLPEANFKVCGSGLTRDLEPMLISDDENIYRSIPNHPDMVTMVEGKPRFSSSAFNDRTQKVSVDQASLREYPEQSKMSETDGIVSLITAEVRAIDSVADADSGLPYRIDVIERPIIAGNPDGLPENLAHAQVESAPELSNKSRFKKLKEALARLATNRGWLIGPS